VDPKGQNAASNTASSHSVSMESNTSSHHGKGSKRGKRKSKSTPTPAQNNDDSVFTELQQPATSNQEEEEGSFFLIDTDTIAHEILLPPALLASDPQYTIHPNDSVYEEAVETFADLRILDEEGLIDRRKLGAVIFPDATRRRQLNKLTHPRILLILVKRLLQGIFWSYQDIVCADIPLLFESGQLRRLFALTIVVACDPAIQLQRLKARNPDLTEAQCQERIASQIPIQEKAKLADVVIWNNGDQQELARKVEDVRRDVMGRLYGIGMSLLQMLLLVGGSLSLAVSSKLFANVWVLRD
jgi:dephospho-CoA kinase